MLIEKEKIENTLLRNRLSDTIERKGLCSEGNTRQFKVFHQEALPVNLRWIFKVTAGVDKGRKYLAVTPEIRIGRHSDNQINLSDSKVSRFHALLRLEGQRIFIKDLHSTNGTRVNGRLIAGERELRIGEVINIGDTILQWEMIAAENCNSR